MRQSASLKVCVLGGRSFGKTSLLSSLIAISGTKEAGISALGDNQRKLAIYNDYKDGHGKLSATSWDDICQFRYKITGRENKRWVVSFIDYPGEFFQKFFEDENAGILNGVLAKLKTSGQSGKTNQDDMTYGGEEKKAKRIFSEILSADALIVLLPADSERTEYKKLLPTFRARLEALLQTIEERNPYIPVCLAINKSDMLENRTVENLFESTVFAAFHNMLTRERGQNYFYQAVSAFGGNKANGLSPETENIDDLRQTWDGKSEPQNVLSMLIKISEMAEEGRYKLLRERFDKASIVAKTLKWPFAWLHVRGLGANKEEDRKYCVKNLLRCIVRFAVFSLVSAFAAFCAVSTGYSLCAWVDLCRYERKLSSAEQSCKGDLHFILGKDVIKELCESRPRQLGRLVFFCNQKLGTITQRYEDLEDDRNWRLFTTSRKACEDTKLCDGGDSMAVEERLNRFSARIACYQSATNEIFGSETRIGNNENLAPRGSANLLVGEKLSKLIAGEIKCRGDLEGDADFYRDLRDVRSASAKDFCKEAEKFLAKYQSVKEHLKDKCEQIKKELDGRETELSDVTNAYLTQHADDQSCENYQDRISRAELRIKKVDELFDQASTKLARKKEYECERERDRELVQNLNADKPFYEALKKLREDNAAVATGKVRRIYAFLEGSREYGRCESFMVPFRLEYSNELCRIQNECRTAVANNSFDVPAISTAKKIGRINNQIKAYTDARDEYVVGSAEYGDADSRVKHLGGLLAAVQKTDECEMALDRITKSSYSGRLKALDRFQDKYKEILADQQKGELSKLVNGTLRHWQEVQATNEVRYAIREDDALSKQKQNVEELEKVYSALMEEMLPNSAQYVQFEQKKRELGDRKRAIEHDQKLENALRALPSTNAVERCSLLNAIDGLESEYHVADYTSKHAKMVFNQLNRKKDEAEHAFLADYTNLISKVQCPPETNFLGRCQWADDCKKITEESYRGLNSNNVIRLRLATKYENYKEQHLRFAKLSDLASQANEIADKTSANDVRVACDRLSEIKKFYSNYPPKDNQDPLVRGLYLKVKHVREGSEDVIYRYVEKELEKLDGELPYGASGEKKLEVWGKKLDLLGEYISKFVEGTNPHIVYKQRLLDLSSRFSIEQRKALFYKQYKKLCAEIKNEQGLDLKLQKTREFLSANDDVRLNDFASEKIAMLKKNADRIEMDIAFNDYQDKVDKVVKSRPEEDANGSAFAQFKAQIASFQEDLKKFKYLPHLKSQCQVVCQKLHEQEEYVEKALGDGSWKDVQRKEEKYKNNPCEETEQRLRAALDNFDEKRFGKYLDSKKHTEKNFKKDIELRQKVSLAKGSFFESPSHSAFVEFDNAVSACSQWESSYGCKWSLVEDCSRYISKIKNGIQVGLSVDSVSFSGAWKSVVIGAGPKINGVSQNTCELFKGYLTHDFGIVTVGVDGLHFCVKYANNAAYREVSRSMSFWEILKAGATSGDCRTSLAFEVIEKMWGCEPKQHMGALQLSIRGIPYVP